MTDLTAARPAVWPDLADAIMRKIIMEHETPGIFLFQGIDGLLVIPGAKRRDAQTLGLPAREKRRTVGSRQNIDLAGDGTDIPFLASVRTFSGGEYEVADLFVLEPRERDLHEGLVKTFGLRIALGEGFFIQAV